MSRLPGLYQCTEPVASHFPHLSRPLARLLALGSFGILLARAGRLSTVAGLLAQLLDPPAPTARERLRDFYREAGAKRGEQRAELDLGTCSAPWLRWVLGAWDSPRLALALDATTLGQRFVVSCVRVVYRGCAIPVARKVLAATAPRPGKPEWLALLERLRGPIAPGWTVIVLADRGLDAKWLFAAMGARGGHPLLRINAQGKFRPAGWWRWLPLASLVPAAGRSYARRGVAFAAAEAPLACTLLGYWGAGHEEAWLVVTGLPPQASQACG